MNCNSLSQTEYSKSRQIILYNSYLLCFNPTYKNIFELSIKTIIMDTKKLLKHFRQKTWLWQRVFRNFFIGMHNLYDLVAEKDLPITTIVRLCRNEDDLNELWDLVELIDSMEDDILGEIKDLSFCRPVPWQYDFIKEIIDTLNLPYTSNLCIETVADVYCAALINKNFSIKDCRNRLDKFYHKLYASVSHKETVLRRNLELILDTSYPSRAGETPIGANVRELLDYYLPRCGFDKMSHAIKKARTSDIKLTPEERACLGYSYYSPFVCDESDFSKPIPGSTIFACVEDHLQKEMEYRRELEDAVRKAEDKEDDETEDNIRERLNRKHYCLFIDPMDRCLMDICTGEITYANVYVQKFPDDDLNNSLADFVRFNKGCLYTVEFVEDISQLEVAQDFLNYLNHIKSVLMQMEKMMISKPELGLHPMIRNQYQRMQEEFSKCYYISEKH